MKARSWQKPLFFKRLSILFYVLISNKFWF